MLSYIRIFLSTFGLISLHLGCHSTILIHKVDTLPVAHMEKPPKPEKDLKQSSTLFGIYLISEKEEASCKNQIPAEVRLVTGFGDSIIHFLIGPLYNTKTVMVYCRSLLILDGKSNWGE
ncbi:hypothetical protein EHO59_05815 [Leptospira semungkisensis]|uniref:Uncharacterized protein n=1 Tax=Leptospira semungkisensis TaxID=2484985 RepID=A0A4R9G8M4_9LEPT|nr:hypothetical protein [Leptospira semungkisensis]TGK07615.1 hypothetical protein EHO59_05815 [Leptospira semungkisensis]